MILINENPFVTRRGRLITKEKQSKAGEQGGEKKTRRKEEKVQAPVADVRCSESEHDKF